jgi:tetratricopeptide (TPR) repeat protein
MTVTRLLLLIALIAPLSFSQDKKAEAPKLELADGGKTGLLPDNTRTLAQKAADAFTKRDWNSARAAYREMIEAEPANALAWANLGAVEQQSGRLDEAVTAFEKSVQHNPQLIQSWLALGMIHTNRGDKYRAVAALARAVHEDPLDARGHNYLAIATKSLGWTDAAEAELQRAIDLQPEYGLAHFNLALMYLDRKPPAIELAKRHYDKALSLGVEKDEIVERKLKE